LKEDHTGIGNLFVRKNSAMNDLIPLAETIATRLKAPVRAGLARL